MRRAIKVGVPFSFSQGLWDHLQRHAQETGDEEGVKEIATCLILFEQALSTGLRDPLQCAAVVGTLTLAAQILAEILQTEDRFAEVRPQERSMQEILMHLLEKDGLAMRVTGPPGDQEAPN